MRDYKNVVIVELGFHNGAFSEDDKVNSVDVIGMLLNANVILLMLFY